MSALADTHTTATGVLTFDPGQTSRTLHVAMTDDSWPRKTS
ncbi:MAG: hypothetical protein AB7I50_06055 [Vicinamibacterales bacterium]